MITPEQLAGVAPAASTLLLPAATTTTAPAATTALTALWKVLPELQTPGPPRLRLRTLAGLGLLGTPVTGSPAAQRMPSAISESYPPTLPRTRIGRMRAFIATPTTPVELLPIPAMVPATCVPCQELGPLDPEKPQSPLLNQSPGSLASESRPVPSLALQGSEMKSYPGRTLALRSEWLLMPVSITATTALGEPVVRSQAAGALTPYVPLSPHKLLLV